MPDAHPAKPPSGGKIRKTGTIMKLFPLKKDTLADPQGSFHAAGQKDREILPAFQIPPPGKHDLSPDLEMARQILLTPDSSLQSMIGVGGSKKETGRIPAVFKGRPCIS